MQKQSPTPRCLEGPRPRAPRSQKGQPYQGRLASPGAGPPTYPHNWGPGLPFLCTEAGALLLILSLSSHPILDCELLVEKETVKFFPTVLSEEGFGVLGMCYFPSSSSFLKDAFPVPAHRSPTCPLLSTFIHLPSLTWKRLPVFGTLLEH